MCLQWCYVNNYVLDNDYPCDHCPDCTRYAHSNNSCDHCRHYRKREDNSEICSLTKMILPVSRTCCHWNAQTLPEDTEIYLDKNTFAPGLMELYGAVYMHQIFDWSDTGTENYRYAVQNGKTCLVVSLAELAVPFVYGHSAEEWDELLTDVPEEIYWICEDAGNSK